MKLISVLRRTAELSKDEKQARKAMASLREINPTYHWCPEWDYMVICNTDMEYKACLCKAKKRDI